MPSATADLYAEFAATQAHGYAPMYEEICRGVADDPELVAALDRLPRANRIPNLLLGVVRLLGGPVADYRSFRAWTSANWSAVAAEMLVRSTQTNEAGRCATLLPVLGGLPGPLSLIEVGASAGLCLQPDRYRYSYDGGPEIGPADSPVLLSCRTSGSVPVPTAVPDVIHRVGIDLSPLDPSSPDDLAWLEALVWPGQPERLDRLRAATTVAARDPAPMVTGDLIEVVQDVVDACPAGSTVVVFHTAVLVYLSAADRRRFAATMATSRARWLSNEGPGVFPDIAERVTTPAPPQHPAPFVLALDGRPVAWTSPHGASISWL